MSFRLDTASSVPVSVCPLLDGGIAKWREGLLRIALRLLIFHQKQGSGSFSVVLEM